MNHPKMTKNVYGPAPMMIAHETIMERAEEKWAGSYDYMAKKVAKMLAPRVCWLVIQEYKATIPTWWGNDSRFDAYVSWKENGEEKFWQHPDNSYYTTLRREVKRVQYNSLYEAIEAKRLIACIEDKFWPICECDQCQNTTTSWVINELLDPQWGGAGKTNFDAYPF